MCPAQKKYTEILDWLDSQNQNKIIPGLERIAKLMNILKNPQKISQLIFPKNFSKITENTQKKHEI